MTGYTRLRLVGNGYIVKQQYKRHFAGGAPGLAGKGFFDLEKDPREEHPLMVQFLWASYAASETITAFPSPYMNARDTELATMDNGAVVGADTKAYWDLHPDAPERASYDEDIIAEVADGVWTIGTAGLVNSHVVRGPKGLIVYDTGENDAEGTHLYVC